MLRMSRCLCLLLCCPNRCTGCWSASNFSACPLKSVQAISPRLSQAQSHAVGVQRYVLPMERRQRISQSCKQAWLANPQRREQQRERCKVATCPVNRVLSSPLLCKRFFCSAALSAISWVSLAAISML